MKKSGQVSGLTMKERAKEVDKDEKLWLGQLLKYYVDRYELYKSGTSFDSNSGCYRKLQRIIDDTEFMGGSLWKQTIKLNDGHFKITIKDFEDQCLDKWLDYLEKTYSKSGNMVQLQQDRERWDTEHYWQKKTKEAKKAERKALEEGAAEEIAEAIKEAEEAPLGVTMEDAKQKCREMMLEALYAIFYEPFQLEALYQDMRDAEVLSEADETPESLSAKEKLKDFRNYAVEKKAQPFVFAQDTFSMVNSTQED